MLDNVSRVREAANQGHARQERKNMKSAKRLMAAASVLALSAFALSACSDSTGTEAETLVVGFDSAYPPYGYVADDGSYTGFDLDLAEEVAKRNGWEFKAEPIDWDAKDAQLNSGAIDVIWNGFTMEGREGKYAFSEPYMLNEQVIVVKADSDVADFAGLKDKKVMTQTESAALDVLEGDQKELADTFGSLETIGDYNNAFMQLESGMVDAVACDLSIAQYQLAANPDAFKQLDESLSSEHYAVGFKLGDEDRAAKVTETLKEMDADGTVKTIIEKYSDQGMSYDNWVLGK